VCAWAAVAAGIWLGSLASWGGAASWLSVSSAACGAAVLLRGKACRAALAMGLVAFGAGWGALREREDAADSLATRLAGLALEAPVRLTGVVSTPIAAIERPTNPLMAFRPEDPGWRFELSVDRLGDDPREGPARGAVTVLARERPAVGAGDRVVVTGAYRAIGPALNPGESDRARWARSRGLVGSVDVPRAALIAPDEAHAGAWARARSGWHAFRGALRARAERSLARATAGLSDQGRVLVHSLLLGRPPPGGAEAAGQLRDSFTRLGLAHVLAISGFHLVVLVAVLLRVVRLAGDPGRLEPIGIAALVLLYLALVPASAPILRAGVLALALVLSEALGRRYDRLTLLAWVALGLLVWRPSELWSLGYQLSCGLTALLLWMGQRVHARVFPPPIRTGTLDDLRWLDPPAWRRLLNAARGLLSTTMLCWLVSSPLVLWRTGLLTPLAIPAAMAVVPLSVLVLAIGFGSLLLGLASPALAGVGAAPLTWSASACVWAVERLDAIPGAALDLPPVSMAWTLAATALWAWWLGWARRRDWRPLALAGLLAFWAGAEWRWAWRPAAPLRIDTLAVGDGSAHLLRAGGESLLWDCGSPSPSAGRLVIRRALRCLGQTRVRTLVLTHPDVDHYSALPDLLGPLGVRRALLSERFVDQARERPGGPAAAALAMLGARGVDVVVLAAGDRFVLGGVPFEVLSPPGGAPWSADNEHSLAAWARVGGRSLLLTGDAQASAIAAMRERWPWLRADVVEAPHHGSAIPAAIEWLSGMAPAVVLQSAGPRRAEDPRWSPSRARSEWLVTARDGSAWVEFGRNGALSWGTFRQRRGPE